MLLLPHGASSYLLIAQPQSSSTSAMEQLGAMAGMEARQDVRRCRHASRALSHLATFLRLHPAKLDVGKWQHELSSRAAPPQPQRLATEERDPLRQLMADTVARTDAMLRAAGYKARVPAAWTQGK